MRVTADTNILVRIITRDDETQAQLARKLLTNAEVVAVPLSGLCELAWVLRSTYNFSLADISNAITTLLNVSNVAVNRPAVEAGLATLDAGGDFADGLIAYEGKWLGGDTFVSFDKKAVTLLMKQGHKARLLA